MKRIQQKATYALIIASKARAAAAKLPKIRTNSKRVGLGVNVLSLGLVLKKRHGRTESFRYARIGRGQIVKVAA